MSVGTTPDSSHVVEINAISSRSGTAGRICAALRRKPFSNESLRSYD